MAIWGAASSLSGSRRPLLLSPQENLPVWLLAEWDGMTGGWRYHGSINAAFDYYSRALLLRRRPTLLDKPAIAPQPPPCALPESPSTCTALRVAHPGWTERRLVPGR